MDSRIRRTTDRMQDWRRQRIDPVFRPATEALAPATGRVTDWRDRFMASEFAPAKPGKPGKAEWWTLGVVVGLLVAIVAFLAWFDWNYLRGPIGRFASERLDREVEIQGDLDVDILRWTPEIRVEGLRMGGPEWARERDTADIEELNLRVRALPLFAGRIEMPSIEARNPVVVLIQDAEGRQSWSLSGEERSDGQGAQLPTIQRLLIEGGDLTYENAQRRVTLNATINARETNVDGEEGGFELTGTGTLNGNAVQLAVTGGPLVYVRRNEPYQFDARLEGAGTLVTAEGQVNRPFDLGGITANVTARGQDLADAYYVTTVPFPNSPPYELSGRLTRDDEVWRFEDFDGRVGESDLHGDVVVSKPNDRRLVEATLRSNNLDLDDLLALTGAPPTSAPEMSPAQREQAAEMNATARLLPDAPLRVERLRDIDARVDFRANNVRANALAVTAVDLGVDLDQGILNLDPIAFDFSNGRLNAVARIDATRDVPYSSLDARLRGYPIQTVLPQVQGTTPLTGALNARVRLEGSGASIHRFADNSSGAISVFMPQGEMRRAFAELLGINASAGLLRLLSGDNERTPIRCAVADFEVANGNATARTLVIDTGVVLVNGTGSVNLGTERLNLRLDGESKQPRLLRVWSPIIVNGPIRAPGVGIDGGSVATQGGLALALGALLSPIAAILPFIDPGLADDADCAALTSGQG